jgi:hypothetical protein
MSELKKKSEHNLIASEFLIKQGLHAPSVHCSYYSCLQILKYTINNFFGIDYDVIDQDIINSKGNSHGYIINYVFREFRIKKIAEWEVQNRQLKVLKELREKSDYDNIAIGSDTSNEAQIIAKNFTNYIKSII